MRGMPAPHVVMSVIACVSTFAKLCMHIWPTWCYMLIHIIIETYLYVHYDYVFIQICMTTNAKYI